MIPRDPVAAMWKAQMLSGMQSTRLSGNPIHFPFFRDQIRTYLESYSLEERFGQTIRVTQACIEELVAGPRLTYGDCTGLMNFSEKLNTATKVLQGDIEREANTCF